MEYTWEEVKCHSGADSLWIVIRGYVYDLTEFLLEHPGGSDELLSVGVWLCPWTRTNHTIGKRCIQRL